ncbi:MAG: DUF4962 domain-containing protein [bacterium]|nr:DUF4962 domain-containing protein [bacterium]
MMRIGKCVLVILGSILATSAWGIELDEEPAGAGEWGYRPADGSTPALNPPGFSWRPCEDAAGYVIQIARDQAFDDIVHAVEDVKWSAYCPPAVLPEGTLYWRYAARGAKGKQSGWSRVRSFTVKPDAVPFPKPSVAEQAARMPKEHPRLFFRPEDIDTFRQLSEGPLADRWRDLVRAADSAMGSPPDLTEPPKYPKGTVRKSDQWRKIWWGNRKRVAAVADRAALLGFVYRISGDEKYALAALDLLLAMTKWDPNGATSFSYNDEAAMPAMYYPARAYTWIRPVLSETDQAAIVEMMRIRGGQAFHRLRHHLWCPYDSHANRAWHFLGEVAIAFYDDIPEAPEWLDYAMTIFYTAYPVWNDEDGGWHEGTGYWASYNARFMWWAFVMRAAFNVDVFDRPYYHRIGDFGLYTLPPGSERTGFGDQATSSNGVRGLMAVLAAGARNPYWRWYADTTGGSVGGSYLGFVFSASSTDLESTPPADLPTSTCFEGVGLAVMNTTLLHAKDNIQIQFKSSPFGTQSHGYNANNSFLLSMAGQRVLLRSGKRDVYGSPHHKDWMWHSRSDNAILVNGESQAKHSRNAVGRITAFETSPTLDAVVGEAGDAYTNLDRWTRRVAFFKPHAILIHDVLEAPEPSTYQLTLHAPGAFEIADGQATWSGEPGSIDVRFLQPAPLTITQTDQFEPPPAEWSHIKLNEWHLTAATPDKAANQQLLTVILLNDAPVDIQQDPADPHKLTLALPDGPASITATPEAIEVVVGQTKKRFE